MVKQVQFVRVVANRCPLLTDLSIEGHLRRQTKTGVDTILHAILEVVRKLLDLKALVIMQDVNYVKMDGNG